MWCSLEKFNFFFGIEIQILILFPFRKSVMKTLTVPPLPLAERRLMRIKGLSQEVTSKDMLRTLAQARQECWDRFLQEKFESECYVEGHDSEER